MLFFLFFLLFLLFLSFFLSFARLPPGWWSRNMYFPTPIRNTATVRAWLLNLIIFQPCCFRYSIARTAVALAPPAGCPMNIVRWVLSPYSGHAKADSATSECITTHQCPRTSESYFRPRHDTRARVTTGGATSFIPRRPSQPQLQPGGLGSHAA